MAELNLYHIDQITNDVKRQEIAFSHLFHDLVDHICCDVEYHMQQGMDFEDAYQAVKAKIGFRGLKKIQQETLYEVDKKYRKMKKVMKISGVSGTILLGFAAIFKINHIPPAGILLSLGALVLSFVFLPSALTVLWKETKSTKKLILFVSAFITGVSFILGMLFKIQHWPGSSLLISLGLLSGMLLFIPSLLYQFFLDKAKKHKRPYYIAGAISVLLYCTGFWLRIMHWPMAATFMLTGTFLLVFIVFPLFTHVQWRNDINVNARFIFMVMSTMLFMVPGALVNLNLQNNYEYGFLTRLEKQNSLITLQKESNQRLMTIYRDSSVFPVMKAIHSETDSIIRLISAMERKMMEIANGIPSARNTVLSDAGNEGASFSYKTLQKPFYPAPVSLMLLPGCKPREILENKISEYNSLILKYTDRDLADLYKPMTDVLAYLPGRDVKGNDLALLPNLNGLLMLESGILASESAALRKITGKNQ